MKTLIGAIYVLFAVLLALSILAAVNAGDGPAAGGAIHAGPVPGNAGDVPVTLEIAPRPVRPMRTLAFTVRAPGYSGDEAWIDLAMPGMSMPPNRVALARAADGTWRGSGTIVRCMSGSRSWTAAVTLRGKPPAVFAFDVVD